MPEQLDNRHSRFRAGDHRRASRTRCARGGEGRRPEDESTSSPTRTSRGPRRPTSSTLPWNRRRTRREARTVYRAFGAKEGHGIGTRQAVDAHRTSTPRARGPARSARRPAGRPRRHAGAPHPWIGGRSDDAERPLLARRPRTSPTGGDPRRPPARARRSASPEESMDPDARRTPGTAPSSRASSARSHPTPRVLSLPGHGPSGIVDDELVRVALRWLLDRCRTAADRRQRRPLRRRRQPQLRRVPGARATSRRRRTPLDTLLEELGDLGVRVVTSAGQPRHAASGHPRRLGAGGLRRDRTGLKSASGPSTRTARPAPYTNHGDWVLAAARGTALVSRLPAFTDVDVARREPRRQAPGLALHEDPNLQPATFAPLGRHVVRRGLADRRRSPSTSSTAGDARPARPTSPPEAASARRALEPFSPMPDPRPTWPTGRGESCPG